VEKPVSFRGVHLPFFSYLSNQNIARGNLETSTEKGNGKVGTSVVIFHGE